MTPRWFVALVGITLSGGAARAQDPPPEEGVPGEAPPVEAPAPPEQPPAEPPPVAPVAAPAPPVTADKPAPEPLSIGPSITFTFGSYGRVSVGSDLAGATPEPISAVAHAPRIVENTYVELELRTEGLAGGGWTWRAVITPVFVGEPFHYTGDLESTRVGVRNLYLETTRRGLRLWAGSRMVRGHDIYLLDFWPLDNLNLVGGGAGYTHGRLELGLLAGANRLLDPFQHQLISVSAPVLGAAEIEQLDRQRVVGAAKASLRVLDSDKDDAPLDLAASVYLEVQGLGSGTRERADGSKEALPGDAGFVVGGELSSWGFLRHGSHANLFLRYGKGLAATDWLAVPAAVGADLKTYPRASELLLGTSTNLELGVATLQLGGYARRFTSAAPDSSTDWWSGWEATLAVRPQVQLSGALGAAVDLSWQKRWPSGLSPTSGTALEPTIVQVAPMLLLTPGGTGGYTRPQLRLVYRAAHLDEGALDLYPLDDPRRDHAWVHFLGVQAEWWFNSTSYN
jgi:maltoporin